MLNVKTEVSGKELVIRVRLDQDFGPSSSGKSLIVASTQGNVPVPGVPDIKMGLNIYRPQTR